MSSGEGCRVLKNLDRAGMFKPSEEAGRLTGCPVSSSSDEMISTGSSGAIATLVVFFREPEPLQVENTSEDQRSSDAPAPRARGGSPFSTVVKVWSTVWSYFFLLCGGLPPPRSVLFAFGFPTL